MIGPGIKKFAEERGLTCGAGRAYGYLHGFCVSLEDGAGTKTLQLYLCRPQDDEEGVRCNRAGEVLTDCDAKEYRLMVGDGVMVMPGLVRINFYDNPGTMKCINRYVDEILPKLKDEDFAPDTCSYCGQPLNGDCKFMRVGEFVVPVHSACVSEVNARVEQDAANEAQQGSVVRGVLGALLGAVVGAISWALAFAMGYFLSILGLAIGALVNWLYVKFGGRDGWIRVVSMCVATILGVTIGQVAGYSLQFVREYNGAGGMDATSMTATQYVETTWNYAFLMADEREMFARQYDLMVENVPLTERVFLVSRDAYVEACVKDLPEAEYAAMQSEARSEFWKNAILGILFGIGGCLGLLMKQLNQTRLKNARELSR